MNETRASQASQGKEWDRGLTFKGRRVTHRTIRKADVCPAIQIGLSDKVIFGNSSLSVPGSLFKFFRLLRVK